MLNRMHARLLNAVEAVELSKRRMTGAGAGVAAVTSVTGVAASTQPAARRYAGRLTCREGISPADASGPPMYTWASLMSTWHVLSRLFFGVKKTCSNWVKRVRTPGNASRVDAAV